MKKGSKINAINEIYSEKFIDKDLMVHSRTLIRFEKKLKKSLIEKSIKQIPEYPLQLVSSDWKKNFSQKKTKFI